ncbi:hypothetical protein L211DRAFT_853634 [Terfezia boudieri ATCC MYA-4762]|uniref:RING-type domain-containing protein n=1 Tax=Terfezia boudieri ATCC MYA-4762 TaxID=1051890 RepID=A0A3N4L7T7_9PEZI|nr:hypothetical protein L211DRAFT_853634 [Terfezia boudieri ATCC MYA-4762]
MSSRSGRMSENSVSTSASGRITRSGRVYDNSARTSRPRRAPNSVLPSNTAAIFRNIFPQASQALTPQSQALAQQTSWALPTPQASQALDSSSDDESNTCISCGGHQIFLNAIEGCPRHSICEGCNRQAEIASGSALSWCPFCADPCPICGEHAAVVGRIGCSHKTCVCCVREEWQAGFEGGITGSLAVITRILQCGVCRRVGGYWFFANDPPLAAVLDEIERDGLDQEIHLRGWVYMRRTHNYVHDSLDAAVTSQWRSRMMAAVGPNFIYLTNPDAIGLSQECLRHPMVGILPAPSASPTPNSRPVGTRVGVATPQIAISPRLNSQSPMQLDSQRLISPTLNDLVRNMRQISIQDTGLPQDLFTTNAGGPSAANSRDGQPIAWRERRPGKQVVVRNGFQVRIVSGREFLSGRDFDIEQLPQIIGKTNPHITQIQSIRAIAFQDKKNEGIAVLKAERLPDILVLFTWVDGSSTFETCKVVRDMVGRKEVRGWLQRNTNRLERGDDYISLSSSLNGDIHT